MYVIVLRIDMYWNCPQDPQKFKSAVRDFIVSIKEISGEDEADQKELFRDEQEAIKAQEAAAKAAVPGIVKPADLVDEEL